MLVTEFSLFMGEDLVAKMSGRWRIFLEDVKTDGFLTQLTCTCDLVVVVVVVCQQMAMLRQVDTNLYFRGILLSFYSY